MQVNMAKSDYADVSRRLAKMGEFLEQSRIFLDIVHIVLMGQDVNFIIGIALQHFKMFKTVMTWPLYFYFLTTVLTQSGIDIYFGTY